MTRFRLISLLIAASMILCLSAAAVPLDDAIQLYKEHKYVQAVQFFEAHYNDTLADANAAYYYALALAESNQSDRARHICEYIVQRYPSAVAAQQAKTAMAQWKPKEVPKAAAAVSKAPRGVIGIKYEKTSGNEYVVVNTVFPGGPAYGQLKVGDLITAVDQIGARGRSIEDLLHRIAGEPNTPVNITVDRSGEVLTVRLLRMSPNKFGNIEIRQGYQNQKPYVEPTPPSPSNAAKHPQFQIPYEMNGSNCMVDALLNGQKLRMCVDSKSAHTIIPIKYIDQSNKARPTGKPQSSDSRTGADVWHTKSKLQLGPLIRDALPIEIVDHASWPETPILGSDFFDGYRRTQNAVTKTLNAVRQDVAIPKTATTMDASKAQFEEPIYPEKFQIDFKIYHGKYMVPVLCHGKELQMCIDSESAKTVIPVQFFDNPNMTRPVRPSPASNASPGGSWRFTQTLQLGPLIREDFPIEILDESSPGVAILGTDFFDGYKSTVNVPGRTIEFVRQTPIPKRQKRKITARPAETDLG